MCYCLLAKFRISYCCSCVLFLVHTNEQMVSIPHFDARMLIKNSNKDIRPRRTILSSDSQPSTGKKMGIKWFHTSDLKAQSVAEEHSGQDYIRQLSHVARLTLEALIEKTAWSSQKLHIRFKLCSQDGTTQKEILPINFPNFSKTSIK